VNSSTRTSILFSKNNQTNTPFFEPNYEALTSLLHVWGYVGTRAQIHGEHTNLKLIFSPISSLISFPIASNLQISKHPYAFDTSKWFPWSTMDVRGANTFPLHNRLPNPLLVARPFLSFGVLSLFSLSFGINKIRWRLCIFRSATIITCIAYHIYHDLIIIHLLPQKISKAC